MIFFGTNNLACTVLSELLEGGFSFDAVVTQPDKPVGRGKKLQAPPIKRLAEKYNIPVLQFAKLDSDAQAQLVTHNADLFIVAEYGLLIPPAVLDLPRHGTLNVHPSMLPEYRGATPIQSALISGQTMSGVTVMLLDEGMDHGPIITQATAPIADEDTYITLEAKLGRLGAELLKKNIQPWLDGKITAKEQYHAAATFCSKIQKKDGLIQWSDSAENITNKWRAYAKWPGVFSHFNGKLLKISDVSQADQTNKTPGTVFVDSSENLYIACGDGSILVERLQLSGKKQLSSIDFLRGHSDIVDSVLK